MCFQDISWRGTHLACGLATSSEMSSSPAKKQSGAKSSTFIFLI